MFRVYDTNVLWRHDEILRIRHLEAEIADMQKDIDRQKEQAVAANPTSPVCWPILGNFGYSGS